MLFMNLPMHAMVILLMEKLNYFVASVKAATLFQTNLELLQIEIIAKLYTTVPHGSI